MTEINYVVWKEGKYFVSKCINVEVSSFGETIDEAISNLKEAVELYIPRVKIAKLHQLILLFWVKKQ